MFRFILFIIFGALVVLFAIVLHVAPWPSIFLFLLLGGLLTSTSEDLAGYNFVDWLKDRILALIGWFQSYSHAKIATLRSKSANLAVKIMAEERKIAAAAGTFKRNI